MEKITAENIKNFDSEVDYTTVLDNFEGPLDLLLFLIKENKIEIKDIFVSEVTQQFLTYMKALPYIDMEKASEYLNIAATIIDIKARSLVPPPDDEDYYQDYVDDEDPQEELIRALEEYQMLKEEATKLKERETVGYYYKTPDATLSNVQVKYKDLTLDGLVAAFTKLMMKKETQKNTKNSYREIPRDTFTVKDKVRYICEKLKQSERISFESLFEKSAQRSEIVTTFQALLELLKNQKLRVIQDSLFSEIIIENVSIGSEEDEIGEIDEYN